MSGAGAILLQWIRRAALRDREDHDWLLVLALAGATLAVREAWLLLIPGMPLIVFLPVLAVVALAAGWQSGVLFLAASCATSWLRWTQPFWAQFDEPQHETALVLVDFAIVGAAVIAVGHGARRLLRRSHAQHVQLQALSRKQAALVVQQAVNFREMQHRIANNLQFVSNMLAMSQIDVARGADPQDVLERAMARLDAMSQLHRRLHDIATYRDGVGEVLEAMLGEVLDKARVKVALHLDPAPLSLDQMTALVLFVTEAATNADKHVFRHGQGGRLDVRLDPVGAGRLRLCVRDDGPGIPATATGTATAAPAGLGLRIMDGLAGQLGGTLQTDDSAGHAVSVEFSPA